MAASDVAEGTAAVRGFFHGSYVQQLLEGEGEAGLVVGGSFGLHVHDGLLEDLLVANVGLDQSPEAGNHGVGLLVELEEGNTETRC